MSTRAAEEHQRGQDALVGLILPLLAKAWLHLDMHDLKGTLPTFKAVVAAIVRQFGAASAVAALDFYRSERNAAGVAGAPAIRLPGQIPQARVDAIVDYATEPLWSPPKSTPLFDEPSAPTKDLPQGGFVPDEQLARERLDAAAEQLVLDQSRQTLMDAVQQDKYARAWVRVPEADACSFCLMLALRGATYTDQRSAGKGANDLIRKNGKAFAAHYLTPSDFKVHDHCRCHVEPVFTAYEPSARMREVQQVWKDSTEGRSGNDARNAFRQAMEGREVTGTTGAKKAKVTLGKSSMDRAQAEFLLKQAQGMKDSPWRTKQIARLSKLLAL